jgi:hypothetical protein
MKEIKRNNNSVHKHMFILNTGNISICKKLPLLHTGTWSSRLGVEHRLMTLLCKRNVAKSRKVKTRSYLADFSRKAVAQKGDLLPV